MNDGAVYVAEECWDYEGCNTLGVFTSKDDAITCIQDARTAEPFVDTWTVMKFPLDCESKGELVLRLEKGGDE